MNFPIGSIIGTKILPLSLLTWSAGISTAHAAVIDLSTNEAWIGIIGLSVSLVALAATGTWYFGVFRKRGGKEKKKERVSISVLGQLKMSGRLKISVIEVGELWLVVSSDGQTLQSLAKMSAGGKPLVTSQFILPTEPAPMPRHASPPAMSPKDWEYQENFKNSNLSHAQVEKPVNPQFPGSDHAQATSSNETYHSMQMADQAYLGKTSGEADPISDHLVDYSDPGFPDLIEAISSISPRHAHVATMPNSLSGATGKVARQPEAGKDFRSMYKSNLDTAGSNNEA